jgi:hypothetical protein
MRLRGERQTMQVGIDAIGEGTAVVETRQAVRRGKDAEVVVGNCQVAQLGGEKEKQRRRQKQGSSTSTAMARCSVAVSKAEKLKEST